MNPHPFMGFIAFQQEVLRFQKRQLDMMESALLAGEDEVAFQKSAHEAAQAGIQAWQNWMALWTPQL